MMYEMATGQLPFTAETPVSVALMQVNDDPVPPREINPHIPQGLEQIILKAMEKDPEERYQSAEEMLGQLLKLRENPKIVFRESKNTKKAVKSQPVKTVRKKSSKSMFPIIMGVTLAFLITAGIAAYYLLNSLFLNSAMNNYKMLTVDEFVGHVYDERLEDWLKKNSDSYEYTVEYEYDDRAEAGTIIGQDPLPGEERKILPGRQRCALVLTVSQGEKTVVLKDYSVRDYRLVENELRKLGLRVRTQNVENSVFEIGYVIGTSPEAGSVLRDNDIVTIYVSRGSEETMTIVPDFVGSTEGQAYVLAKENRITVSRVIYSQSWSEPVGTVMKQSLEAWKPTAEFSSVELTISGGSYYTGDGSRIPDKSDYTWSADKLIVNDGKTGGTDTAEAPDGAGEKETTAEKPDESGKWDGGGSAWDGGITDWNTGGGSSAGNDPAESGAGTGAETTDPGTGTTEPGTDGSGWIIVNDGAGDVTQSGGEDGQGGDAAGGQDTSGGQEDWYEPEPENTGGWIFVGEDFYGEGYQP